MSAAPVSLTLIGKPDCHLCDDAREVVQGVMAELATMRGASGAPGAPEITLTEVSILDDAELRERYWEEIPVLLIDGRVHNYWRIDPERLRTTLLGLS